MPSTLASIHRLALLTGASGLAAVTSLALFTPSAKAAGFTASFDPANWILTNTNPDQSLNSTQYTCFVLNDVACVEKIETITGAVDVVGSVSGQQGGNGANIPRTTTWSLTNTGPHALISFDWALDTFGGANQTASYLVNLANVVLSSNDGDSGSITSLLLANGDSFGFRVTTSDNNGDPGILSISSFSATLVTNPASVPGPLPLAGGVAAFAWSRRLRSRLRSRQR
jgi:hypothetical protein